MYFQSVVMNVTDLDRSVEFYCDVFGFTELSRTDQLAAVHAAESERPQVIILRATATSGRIGGAGHAGIRAVVLEVDSLDELERIATALDQRHSLVGRREGSTWKAAFGRDPDFSTIVAGCSLTSEPITLESWAALDGALYAVGE